MGQDWVTLVLGTMTVITAGLIGALIGWIALDVWEYSTRGWRQYALNDKDWARLQQHLQMREHYKRKDVY